MGQVGILTLNLLDELMLARFAGVELDHKELVAEELAPLVEWAWASGSESEGGAGQIRGVGLVGRLQQELRSGNVLTQASSVTRTGFIRVRRAYEDTENGAWIGFLASFQRAAMRSGLPKELASQLTGVAKEMEDNVHLHSRRPTSGLIVFASHEAKFEFAICDRGIGVLASLQEAPEFAQISDHGTALRLAVSDGTSKYGSSAGHGTGFSDLTVGVANSNALVRFRSGDYLLELDGRGAERILTRCVQRAGGRGFLISVQVGR